MAEFQVTADNTAEVEAAAAASNPNAPAAEEETIEVPAESAEAPAADAEAPEAPLESLEVPETPEVPESVSDQLDMEAYAAEFAEKGELSPESREAITAALEKAGFPDPDAVLDSYMGSVSAQAELVRTEAFAVTGGEEGYKAMVEWATDNLSAEDQAAYNEAVNAGPRLAKLAVRGLHAQFTSATGTAPVANPRVQAGPTTQAGLAPIKSMQQLSEITADPRYDKDPAFRKEVEQRVAASMKAGFLND